MAGIISGHSYREFLEPAQGRGAARAYARGIKKHTNLNFHRHCLVLDGVYRTGVDGTPEFVEVPAPTYEAEQAVLHKIITRTMTLPTRRGVLVEEEGSTFTIMRSCA